MGFSVRSLSRIPPKLVRVACFPLVYLVLRMYAALRGKTIFYARVPMHHLGGTAISTDVWLRKTRNRPDNVRYVVVREGHFVANPYFHQLIKRQLTVVDHPVVRWLLSPLFEFRTQINVTDEFNYPMYDNIGSTTLPAVDWFNAEDHSRGKELLRSMGVDPETQWYVCFFARDNQYSKNNYQGAMLDTYIAYNTCRNGDIDEQIPAMKFIIEQGGVAIRIGSQAQKPVKFKHPRLIDYPFGTFQSDFADIYLACHSRFVIGCSAGITDVSCIVDMPFAFVNSELYLYRVARRYRVFIPKIIRNVDTGRCLTLSKYRDLVRRNGPGLYPLLEHMQRERMVHVDNDSTDILHLVQAMYEQFVRGEEVGATKRIPEYDHGEIWGEFLQHHQELLAA